MSFPFSHRARRRRLSSYLAGLIIFMTILLAAACSLNRALALPILQQPSPPTQTVLRQASQLVPLALSPNEPLVGTFASHSAATLVPANRLAFTASPTQSLANLVPPSTQTGLPTATNTPGVLAASDLLFIGGNRLLRWDAITQFSNSLAENVSAFSPNSTGSKIALLRPRGVSANGNELSDLDILDFSSKQVTHLLEGAPHLLNPALSPDGQWLAYLQMNDYGRAIFLLSLSASSPAKLVSPIKLGQCQNTPGTGCTNLSWSPDSQKLLWGDSRGLWVAQAQKGAPSLLHDARIEIADPQGKTSQIEALFLTPQWSPTGRFILAEVAPLQSNASWHMVIDSLTGRSGQVMDSYKLSPEQVSVNWLSNGQLAVARSADLTRLTPAAFQIWDVLATNPALLVSALNYPFPAGIIPSNPNITPNAEILIAPLNLGGIQQSNPGHLLFSARLQEASSQTSLYTFNLLTSIPVHLSQMSMEVVNLLWAPDGSGALVYSADGKLLFVPADGTNTLDLTLAAGQNPHNFVWLPSSLRK